MINDSRGFNRYLPPTPSEWSFDEDNGFLNDMDKLIDKLPQPFHRVEKLLEDLLDKVWQSIESNEYVHQLQNEGEKNLKKVLYEQELCLLDRVNSIMTTKQSIILTYAKEMIVYQSEELRILFQCDLFTSEDKLILQTDLLYADENCTIFVVKYSDGMLIINNFFDYIKFGVHRNLVFCQLVDVICL